MRKIYIAAPLLTIVIAVYFFSFRGMPSDGFIDVLLHVEGSTTQSSGMEVEVSPGVLAKVTAVTSENSQGFNIHSTIYCPSVRKFSLSSFSWRTTFLASASETESALRKAFGVDEGRYSSFGRYYNLLP